MKKYKSIMIVIMVIIHVPLVISEPSEEQYNYVIITTEDVVSAIEASSFIEWKETIGYSIRIVTIENSQIINQDGNDIQEKVRNFLRSHYQEWSIQFVLIIDDNENIPMRYCYPNRLNHNYDPLGMFGGDHPTDYYYADLSYPDSESWDKDGDGYYGEYSDDSPDFEAEVYVGRIPTCDPNRITYTLNKIVKYEQDTGDWKNNALHASSFFYFDNQDNVGIPEIDTSRLWEKVAMDCMNGWKVTKFSEKSGVVQTIYPGDPISEKAFIDEWRENKYGIVNWGGHGNPLEVIRYVWMKDDGDGIPEMNAGEISTPTLIDVYSNLDDDYPSIICAYSCMVGFLDKSLTGNRILGADLLTKPGFGAAVGIVCNSKVLYAMEDYPNDEGLVESIYYYFYHFLINQNQLLGEALYNGKHYVNSNFPYQIPSEEYIEYICQYIVNLYGDPSLNRIGIQTNCGPDKPILQGPTEVNVGVNYYFQATTSDKDADDIYYYFDWGDGTFSEWVGPYKSDEICRINHSWTKRNTFMVNVQAKDSTGLYSEWSDPIEVAVSKSKIQNLIIFFFEYFNNFKDIINNFYFMR